MTKKRKASARNIAVNRALWRGGQGLDYDLDIILQYFGGDSDDDTDEDEDNEKENFGNGKKICKDQVADALVKVNDNCDVKIDAEVGKVTENCNARVDQGSCGGVGNDLRGQASASHIKSNCNEANAIDPVGGGCVITSCGKRTSVQNITLPAKTLNGTAASAGRNRPAILASTCQGVEDEADVDEEESGGVGYSDALRAYHIVCTVIHTLKKFREMFKEPNNRLIMRTIKAKIEARLKSKRSRLFFQARPKHVFVLEPIPIDFWTYLLEMIEEKTAMIAPATVFSTGRVTTVELRRADDVNLVFDCEVETEFDDGSVRSLDGGFILKYNKVKSTLTGNGTFTNRAHNGAILFRPS